MKKMKQLTIGKYRGLQQCATTQGALSVLAVDHRNNLRRALNPADPGRVSDAQMMAFKQQVAKVLAPAASAILLDPEVGLPPCIAAGVIPGGVGIISAVEATGYTGDPAARESGILANWSVEKAKRMGANAIKLLVYYHPDAVTAPSIENLVAQVAEDCARHDIVLFLEPLSYSLDPGHKKLFGDEKGRVVIETARRLSALGGDVLKAEFPLDFTAYPDAQDWQRACAALTEASTIPWVLLSASVDFETYVRQAAIACQSGASGVAVGRAVWKEASGHDGDARREFLTAVALPRMQRITALCDALAKPWTASYAPPPTGSKFYVTY